MTLLTLATSDGDLTPDFALAADDAAVRQRIAERLRLWLGEWYLDTLLGVPYLDDVLRGVEYEDVARNVIRQAASEVGGVAEVVDVTLATDRLTRWVSISVTVTTEYGGEVTAAV